MGLYKDFKAGNGVNSKEEVKEVKVEVNNNTVEDKAVEDKAVENNVSTESKKRATSVDEQYSMIETKFYKRKEFFVILAVVIVAVFLLGFLAYTPSFVMEDLNGQKQSYVEEYAKAHKLSLAMDSVYSDKYASGEAFDQTLVAGDKVKENSTLGISISKGPDYSKPLDYPDFSTMTYEEALEWKKENFAQKTNIIQEYSTSVESGVFIREKLGDGVSKTDFARNSKVDVVYSKGVEPPKTSVVVPKFNGKTVAEANEWAAKESINLIVIESFDNYATKGTIFQQSVPADTKIAVGADFTITVSKGKGVVVPNFRSVTGTDAPKLATSSKVNVTVTEIYSVVAVNRLVSQDIPAGSRIDETDTVNLVYSIGLVPIGNYKNTAYPTFVGIVNEFNTKGGNIIINVVYIGHVADVEPGTIVDHNYINQMVLPGTTVTIYVTS